MNTKKPTRQQKKILKLLADGCWISFSSAAGIEAVSIRDDFGPSGDRMWTRRNMIVRLRQEGWIDRNNSITEAGREAAGIKP